MIWLFPLSQSASFTSFAICFTICFARHNRPSQKLSPRHPRPRSSHGSPMELVHRWLVRMVWLVQLVGLLVGRQLGGIRPSATGAAGAQKTQRSAEENEFEGNFSSLVVLGCPKNCSIQFVLGNCRDVVWSVGNELCFGEYWFELMEYLPYRADWIP